MCLLDGASRHLAHVCTQLELPAPTVNPLFRFFDAGRYKERGEGGADCPTFEATLEHRG